MFIMIPPRQIHVPLPAAKFWVPPAPAKAIELPYPPSVNHYWRVVNGRPIISAEGRKYKTVAAMSARAQGMTPLHGPVLVTVDVYRPRRVGDLDNTLKALLDALKGVAFEDDGQVVGIKAMRHDDKHRPRATIKVEAFDAECRP